MAYLYDEHDDGVYDEGDDDLRDPTDDFLGEEGCLFPRNCCMPGIHYTSECYTPEMAEDFEAETLIPEAVAYLISRGFTVEDFAREVAKHNQRENEFDPWASRDSQ
jgi:hypothetical protein